MLLVAALTADMIDTTLKGQTHFKSLCLEYPILQGLLIFLALSTIPISNRDYHVAFAGLAFAVDIWWIATRYYILR